MKKTQSLAGYIREHLVAIEARLSVGVRQDVIVQELASIGYETTLQAFRNLLYRARKRTEVAKPTEKQQTKVEEPKSALKDRLKKPTGFQYGGTQDESDLI